MTEHSHAHLPAMMVVEAARGTLCDIEVARDAIFAGMVDQKRGAWPWPFKRSVKKAMVMVSSAELEAVSLHRYTDEHTANLLLDLAAAAADDDPMFRIYVSAQDFQVIKRCYSQENEHE